ncbi:MAG: DUF6265 family protein [Pseudomonadota bacterium]
MKPLLPALMIAGCATASAEPPPSLDWLTGCWQSPSGAMREVWSTPEGGHLFGYNVAVADGAVGFFEQMRVDPGPPAVFNAYPAGAGPSPFTEIERGASSIVFANAEHDYPQRIAYTLGDPGLRARISLIDGSQPRDFVFEPCPS